MRRSMPELAGGRTGVLQHAALRHPGHLCGEGERACVNFVGLLETVGPWAKAPQRECVVELLQSTSFPPTSEAQIEEATTVVPESEGTTVPPDDLPGTPLP